MLTVTILFAACTIKRIYLTFFIHTHKLTRFFMLTEGLFTIFFIFLIVVNFFTLLFIIFRLLFCRFRIFGGFILFSFGSFARLFFSCLLFCLSCFLSLCFCCFRRTCSLFIFRLICFLCLRWILLSFFWSSSSHILCN